MPSAEDELLQQWLAGHGEQFRRCVFDLEFVEKWPTQDDDICKLAVNLADELKKANAVNVKRLTNPDLMPHLVFVLAHLPAGWRLWLIEMMDREFSRIDHPLFGSELVMHSERDQESLKVLHDCLATIERRKALERIFAPDRLKLVLKALNN